MRRKKNVADRKIIQKRIKRIVNGRLNASWKICSLAVNGHGSFYPMVLTFISFMIFLFYKLIFQIDKLDFCGPLLNEIDLSRKMLDESHDLLNKD